MTVGSSGLPARSIRWGADGKLVWTFSVAGLPALQVSAGGDSTINEAGDNSNDDNNNNQVNGQFVQVNGRLVQIAPNGGVVNVQRIRRMNGGLVVVRTRAGCGGWHMPVMRQS